MAGAELRSNREGRGQVAARVFTATLLAVTLVFFFYLKGQQRSKLLESAQVSAFTGTHPRGAGLQRPPQKELLIGEG